MTADVDVVHLREVESVERLLSVLTPIDAVYRNDERRIPPTASHLMGPGHQLLMTCLGPLDVLGTLDDEAYPNLLGHCSCKLIELKRKTGRPKDMAVLPVPEATLEVTRKR